MTVTAQAGGAPAALRRRIARAALGALLALMASGAGCRGRLPPLDPSAGATFLAVAAEAARAGAASPGEAAATPTAAAAMIAEAEAQLSELAAAAAAAVARGEPAAAALRRLLFVERGFEREVERKDPRFMLLPAVLRDRRGSCVGLGTLYLALAERLGLPAHGVLVPGHFFVRVGRGAEARNVELLRQGEEMPEAWYVERYSLARAALPAAYLRRLSTTEVAAVIRFNLGNALREAGQIRAARDAYAQARTDFPQFPEAHASLGLARQLLGELPAARQAYEAALRLHPGLPGLSRNLAVLDAEIAGRRAPAP